MVGSALQSTNTKETLLLCQHPPNQPVRQGKTHRLEEEWEKWGRKDRSAVPQRKGKALLQGDQFPQGNGVTRPIVLPNRKVLIYLNLFYDICVVVPLYIRKTKIENVAWESFPTTLYAGFLLAIQLITIQHQGIHFAVCPRNC